MLTLDHVEYLSLATDFLLSFSVDINTVEKMSLWNALSLCFALFVNRCLLGRTPRKMARTPLSALIPSFISVPVSSRGTSRQRYWYFLYDKRAHACAQHVLSLKSQPIIFGGHSPFSTSLSLHELLLFAVAVRSTRTG